MQKLQHVNIVNLVGNLSTERHIYLILEYCPGGDLSLLIRDNGPLSETVARHLLRQLALGLKFMRGHNMVHRDLKPQNLLLMSHSGDALLKIADFGFARCLQDVDLAATLCGSPLYMAPEILKYQKYDVKADLWSVGAIFFEMVTGRTPFTGANHMQLIQRIESTELKIPANNLSPASIDLLQGLLKRNPVERIGWDEFFTHPFFGGQLENPGQSLAELSGDDKDLIGHKDGTSSSSSNSRYSPRSRQQSLEGDPSPSSSQPSSMPKSPNYLLDLQNNSPLDHGVPFLAEDPNELDSPTFTRATSGTGVSTTPKWTNHEKPPQHPPSTRSSSSQPQQTIYNQMLQRPALFPTTLSRATHQSLATQHSFDSRGLDPARQDPSLDPSSFRPSSDPSPFPTHLQDQRPDPRAGFESARSPVFASESSPIGDSSSRLKRVDSFPHLPEPALKHSLDRSNSMEPTFRPSLSGGTDNTRASALDPQGVRRPSILDTSRHAGEIISPRLRPSARRESLDQPVRRGETPSASEPLRRESQDFSRSVPTESFRSMSLEPAATTRPDRRSSANNPSPLLRPSGGTVDNPLFDPLFRPSQRQTTESSPLREQMSDHDPPRSRPTEPQRLLRPAAGSVDSLSNNNSNRPENSGSMEKGYVVVSGGAKSPSHDEPQEPSISSSRSRADSTGDSLDPSYVEPQILEECEEWLKRAYVIGVFAKESMDNNSMEAALALYVKVMSMSVAVMNRIEPHLARVKQLSVDRGIHAATTAQMLQKLQKISSYSMGSLTDSSVHAQFLVEKLAVPTTGSQLLSEPSSVSCAEKLVFDKCIARSKDAALDEMDQKYTTARHKYKEVLCALEFLEEEVRTAPNMGDWDFQQRKMGEDLEILKDFMALVQARITYMEFTRKADFAR